ncbi:MAG TPA: HlyD family efflux transporter periplasmic adaptor subunit [Amphiplicatus sp.]|nr:efflux RND transporter periplasmic adaptor subunit [Amphiplicatus sp.]HOP19503.1 HlyD family efflux transporter periplasmic adaptor subunit [Amphiplicatus sp.]
MRSIRPLAACLLLQVIGASVAVAQPTLELSDKQIERLGIRVAGAQAVQHAAIATLPARVIPAQSSSRTIAAPFGGVVASVDKLPGTEVGAGEPILTLLSRDYFEASAGLAQAQAENDAALAAFNRQKTLVSEGIDSGASLEAAEARARSANAALNEMQRALEYTAPSEKGGYALLSPSAGRVEQLAVMPGDAVDPMTPLGIVVSTAALWLEAQLPADLAGEISAGDSIELEDGSTGAILSASSTIDPKTRSSVLYAEAPAGSTLKVGALTRLTLLKAIDGEAMLRVPSAAVVRLGDKNVVFHRTSDGFAIVDVIVESRTADTATITGDLKPGEELAVSGLAELKAMALQEAS